MSFRQLSIFTGIFVLAACLLQAVGVIQLGSTKLTFGWVGYLTAMFGALFITDFYLKFRPKSFSYIYLTTALHIGFFSLAIAFDWYASSHLINRAQHLLGGTILVWAVWELVSTLPVSQKVSMLTKSVLVFSLATAFGVANEVIELGLDFLLHEETIGPELWDTNIDLLMNWLGMALFFILLGLFRKLRVPANQGPD